MGGILLVEHFPEPAQRKAVVRIH